MKSAPLVAVGEMVIFLKMGVQKDSIVVDGEQKVVEKRGSTKCSGRVIDRTRDGMLVIELQAIKALSENKWYDVQSRKKVVQVRLDDVEI